MTRSSSVPSARKSKAMRRRDRRDVNRRSRRRRLAAVEPLESRLLLAFTTTLLADVNLFGLSADPDSLIEFNSAVFFVADDGVTGSELWTSDGTEAGTVQIADLLPGSDGSQPRDLTVVDGELFFTALDEDADLDLWKSDGTTAGTVMVLDADEAGVYYLSDLTESGGKLFFVAFEEASGYELWVSDGSSFGTTLVKDINPDQQNYYGPQELTDVGGTLFFTSYQNGYANRELFKSNGTADGTVLVANINSDPYEGSNPSNLTNVGGTLFFAASDLNDGVELYKSNGTTIGTTQIGDLRVGRDSSDPQDLTPFNGQLFFSADDGTGRQLFKSDGNSIELVANAGDEGEPSNPRFLTVVGSDLFFASTRTGLPAPVAAVAPTLTTSNSFNGAAGVITATSAPNLGEIRTASATGIAVTAPSGANGIIGGPGVGLSTLAINDLFLTDVDSGDLAADVWAWELSDPVGLTEIDFSGFISGTGFGRLQTDPVPEGVRFELFLNGSPTPASTLIVDGAALNDWNGTRTSGNLALSAAGGLGITSATVRMTLLGPSGVNGAEEALVVGATLTATGAAAIPVGRELFKTNGTNTELVKDIVPVGSSTPTELTEVNGKLFFTADDPITSGRELWVSDGTGSGTQLVQDIRSGSNSAGVPLSGKPEHLTEVNNRLFFTVVDDLNDRELWVSDGTLATTDRVKNINAGTQDANIQQVTPVGNKVFFVADDGIHGEAVWVADPAAGTVTLAADVTPSSSDKVSGLTEFNGGVAFFNDSLGIHHTDGTTTTQLSDQTPVDLGGVNRLFVEANGLLFLVIDDPTVGEELYSITPAGSLSLVADLYVDAAVGSNPRELVAFNNRVFFSATDFFQGFSKGNELYSSDGTTISLVTNINPNGGPSGSDSSSPRDLTVSGNRLFFTADDGTNGRELWSATSANSATMASDIRPGSSGSNPFNLTDAGGTLYFAANNGSNGVEPFMSDGTDGGTAMVANVNSGDSNPGGFLQVGSSVYFDAYNNATGRELYRTDGTPGGTAIVADLQPGPASSDPIALSDAGFDRVLVSAVGTGVVNRELWIAGGPISGMALASDISVEQILDVGSDRLAIADDGVSGNELYRLTEAAPTVQMTDIMNGAAQRSSIGNVRLTFDSEVDVTGDPFSFVNTTTAAAVDHLALITIQNGQTVVDFTFISGPSVNSNGLLMDGTYELTVNAGGVHSLGLALDGDGDGDAGDDYVFGDEPVDKFFRKFGDNDGGNFVNLVDFAAFRGTYGVAPGEPGFNSAMDNDGDNDVDLADFAAFRANYGS